MRDVDQNINNDKEFVPLGQCTFAVLLNDDKKGKYMKRLIKKTHHWYANVHQYHYQHIIAIFVSKHKVLDTDDYKMLGHLPEWKIQKAIPKAKKKAKEWENNKRFRLVDFI